MREIVEIAKAKGISIFSWVSPVEKQMFYEEYDVIHTAIRNLIEPPGIEYHDPTDFLRKNGDKRWHYTDGVHFSEGGHHLMANYLAGTCKRDG